MKYADVSGESFVISSESKVNSETDKYAKKYAKKVIAGCPSDGRTVSINLHLSIPEKIQTRLGSHFCNNEECYAVEIGENDINLYALSDNGLIYAVSTLLQLIESDNDYFAKELAIARNTGIVNGIGDNKYAPRNTITRQDMMTIVYRAMQKLDVELEAKDVEYADFDDVADYAKEAVSALITAGLVNGKNGKIAPTDYTTRAEVAVLFARILDFIK